MVVAQFVTRETRLPIQRCQLPDRCRIDRRCRHHTFDVLRRRLSRVTRQPRCGGIAFELHPTGDDRVARATSSQCDASSFNVDRQLTLGHLRQRRDLPDRSLTHTTPPGPGPHARPHNPYGHRHSEDDQQHTEELKEHIAPMVLVATIRRHRVRRCDRIKWVGRTDRRWTYVPWWCDPEPNRARRRCQHQQHHGDPGGSTCHKPPVHTGHPTTRHSHRFAASARDRPCGPGMRRGFSLPVAHRWMIRFVSIRVGAPERAAGAAEFRSGAPSKTSDGAGPRLSRALTEWSDLPPTGLCRSHTRRRLARRQGC